MSFTFPKNEKLKGKTDIDRLFQKGKWVVSHPIKLIYLKNDNITDFKLGVSVSKRFFKKAHDRNRIKRLLREYYRLNKSRFHEYFTVNSHIMIMWNTAQLPENLQEINNVFEKLFTSRKK